MVQGLNTVRATLIIRKIVYGFIIILGLLIALAWVAPKFINWNEYKGDVKAILKNSLRRDLDIDGEINLSLIPSPQLIIEKASLSNRPGGTYQHMAKVETIEVSAALLPLLIGKIYLKEIRLYKPTFFFETVGHASNWSFDKSADPSSPAEKGEQEGKKQPYSKLSHDTLSLEKVKIENATFLYLTTGKEYKVEQVNAQVSGSSFSGPFTSFGRLKFNEIDTNFSLTIGKFEADHSVPATFELIYQNSKLSAQGIFSLENKAFLGNMTLVVERNILDPAKRFLTDSLTVLSKITAGKDELKLTETQLQSGKEVNARGEAIVHLTEPQRLSIHLSDLPGRGSLTLESSIKNKAIVGDVKISSQNLEGLKSFLKEYRFVVSAKDNIQATAHFRCLDNQLDFSNVLFSLGAYNVSGSLTAYLAKEPLEFKAQLKTNHLSPWLNLGELNYPHLGFASFNGMLSCAPDNVGVKAETHIAGGKAYIDGSYKKTAEGPSYAFRVDADHSNANELLKNLNIGPIDVLLGRASLNAQIIGHSLSLSFNKLKGSISPFGQPVNFSGSITADMTKRKPFIEANLTFNHINIDQFFKKSSRVAGNSLSARNSAPGNFEHTWSKDAVDLKLLNLVEGNFHLVATSLIMNDNELTDLFLKATLKDGKLTLPSLQSKIFGGRLKASGDLSNSHFMLEATLEDAKLHHLLARNANIDVANGIFFIKAFLDSKGRSPADLVSNLKGDIDLKVTNGTIKGFDLEGISHRISHAHSLSGILNLIFSFMNRGSTRFNSVKGGISIKEGMAYLNNVKLDAPAGQGEAQGTINLPKWALDVQASFKLRKHEKLPPFRMSLTGPLNQPKRRFDTEELKRYLVKQSAKTIRETIQGTIKNKEPEKVLKGLIKELFH